MQQLDSDLRVVTKGMALVGIKRHESSGHQKIGDIVVANAMPVEELPELLVLLVYSPRGLLHLFGGVNDPIIVFFKSLFQRLDILSASGARSPLVVSNSIQVFLMLE